MVFSYAELKGKIKVDDEVKAVAGRKNPCLTKLHNGGREVLKITNISENSFRINNCLHGFDEDGFLDLIDYKKDMTMLEVGDRLDDRDGGQREVLAVLHRNGKKTAYLLSKWNDFDSACDDYTAHELNRLGYTIVDQEPTPTITEMTLEEVAELKGIPVEQLRIKE